MIPVRLVSPVPKIALEGCILIKTQDRPLRAYFMPNDQYWHQSVRLLRNWVGKYEEEESKLKVELEIKRQEQKDLKEYNRLKIKLAF